MSPQAEFAAAHVWSKEIRKESGGRLVKLILPIFACKMTDMMWEIYIYISNTANIVDQNIKVDEIVHFNCHHVAASNTDSI